MIYGKKKESVISIASDPAYLASSFINALAQQQFADFIVDYNGAEERNRRHHEVEETKRACSQRQLQEWNVAENASKRSFKEKSEISEVITHSVGK